MWFRFVDRSNTLRLRYHANQSRDRQPGRGRCPARLSLIDQEQISVSLQRKCNRLGLSEIQLGAELGNPALIGRTRYSEPWNSSEIDFSRRPCCCAEFLIHGIRNQNLRIERTEDLEPANPRKAQDRRGIGDDDQRRAVASILWRSS